MLYDLNRFHREATAGNSKIVELYFRAILPIPRLLSLLTCPPALRKGRPLPHIALKVSTLGGRIVAGITATPTYLRERNITPKRSKKYQTHHLRRVKFSVSRPTFHHSFYREDYSVASIAFLKFKRTVHSQYPKIHRVDPHSPIQSCGGIYGSLPCMGHQRFRYHRQYCSCFSKRPVGSW